jgi:signal transduction histidine kinase
LKHFPTKPRRSLSLRWQIAFWYAALLVIALTVTSGVIVWRFSTIVREQVRFRAESNLNRILTIANGKSPLGLQEGAESPLQVILDPANRDYWSSPETSMEIDTVSGYPLVKTPNLGSERIPPARVSAHRPSQQRYIDVRREPALVLSRFVRVGKTDVVIQLSQSLAIVSRASAQAWGAIAIVLGSAIVAAIALSIVLAARAVNPINELSRAMHEIGYERLDRRLSWPRRDEIGTLAEAFDDLLARLEAAFSRERRFISDASHELKTPVTSINANAQMLLRWADRDERVRRESLETIVHESASLGDMVNGMLTLARADRGDEIPKEPVSLLEEAREVVREATPRAHEKQLALRFVPESDSAIVLGDPNLIRQMIGNLVDNAIKFTEAGLVEVRVGREDGQAWVEVSDTGPGIAPEDMARIFDRFYRGDRSRTRTVPGTGLGLSIVQSIARAHGGIVTVRSGQPKGTNFKIVVPLLTSPS